MTNIILAAESFGLTDGIMTGEGPNARRQRVRESAAMRKAVLDAKSLLESAWAGDRRATMLVNEAITTSDLFKSAAGEVIDREMMAAYDDQPTQWQKIAKRTTLRNFKAKKLVDLVGATNSLARVPEHTNYPAAGYDTAEKEISVGKFGERFGYTFEARINDEIGELEAVPGQWANKARYTEDDTLLSQLANPLTGAPNTSFFNAGNTNLGTGMLTPDRLQTAIGAVTTKRDASGRIQRPGPLQLVVGPALQFTAERVMNTSEIEYTEGGQKVRVPNPFRGKVTLTVMENLPGTAWFVLPTPQAPRPAFFVGFLAGYETPDVRYKADQGKAQGGGDLGVDAGSFDDDTISYRIRHITGAAQGDPRFTYASDGVGA